MTAKRYLDDTGVRVLVNDIYAIYESAYTKEEVDAAIAEAFPDYHPEIEGDSEGETQP